MSSTLRPLNHDDYKCWICLGTADEPPPHNLQAHNWCRPCKCNLVSHQSCLLEWAAEVASSNTRSILNNSKPKTPQCPQCKSPIHIVKSKSFFIQVRERLESANASGFQLFFITVIGGSLASAVYTSLYAVGAASLRCICPKDMALNLLGISLNDGLVQIQPLSFRRMLLVPSIPLVLLLSGTRSTFADVVTLLLPLALSDSTHLPWKFTGPRLTMALLPFVRIGYHILYDSLVEPIIQLCALRIRPSFVVDGAAPTEDEGLRGMGVNIEIVVRDVDNNDNGNDDVNNNINNNNIRAINDNNDNEEEGEEEEEEDEEEEEQQEGQEENINAINNPINRNNNNNNNPLNAPNNGNLFNLNANFNANANFNRNRDANPPRQNIFTVLLGRLGDIFANAVDRALLPVDEVAALNQQIMPPFAGGPGIIQDDAPGIENGDANDGPLPEAAIAPVPRRPRAADWVFSTQGSSLRAGNILLLPLFSGIMGSGLSLIPTLRRLIPSKFNRNILGGMLVIVLRDLINIATALLRVRQENSRRVLDYTEVEARGLAQ